MKTSFCPRDDEVLFADGDPTVMSIYDGPGDVTAAVTRCDADVIGCHESLLGGNIGWVTRTRNVRVHPDSAGGAKLLRCSSGRGSIAVTALGIAGDCGQWSLHYYAHLRGDSLERLLGARPGYRRLRHSRYVVRAAPVPTITGGGFLMGGAIAFDNRRPTLPFLPICRNSDGLWSHCLLTCFDELFVAFLPVVVSHEPPSRRVGVANQANAAVVRLSELLIAVVHQLGLANMSSPGDAKVDLLGRSIAHLASLPGPIFERALRDHVEAVLIARLAEIRERLETSASELHQEPVWRSDLERQATAIKAALIQGRLHIDEFQHAGAPQVRRLLAIAGEMFQCWHSVWTAARDSDLVASRDVLGK